MVQQQAQILRPETMIEEFKKNGVIHIESSQGTVNIKALKDIQLEAGKDINLIGGKVRIKLEPGIQSGKTLRLRNKGIQDINGYSKGDLLVHVNIWTPKVLNKKQKEFFKEMIDDDNFKPNPKKSDKSFFEKVRDMFA